MSYPDIRSDRRFKDALTGGEVVRGTFITVGGAEVVEICGAVGLDYVLIDTEHTPVGWERISAMCLAGLYSGAFPIVRVHSIDRSLATRALDAGARGVMFPQVSNAREAEVAARSCRYPPLGTRGAASTRNQAWGVNMPIADYLTAANEGVVCIVQVETAAAVAEVEEMAAVPGVDCLFVGLSDLSVDLGVPGEFRHPDVEAALDRVIAAARARGISVGVPISDFTLAAGYIERGVTLFATTDRGIVATGMANFLRSI